MLSAHNTNQTRTDMDSKAEQLKEIMTRQALTSINELLQAHWEKALASADDDGKAKIGLRLTIESSANPPKLSVVLGVTSTFKDEVECQLSKDEVDQLELQFS